MVCSPATGRRLKVPKRVQTTFGDRAVRVSQVSPETSEGRSVKSVSPLVSRPVVMLKGRPGVGGRSGWSCTRHFVTVKEPPKKKRWRMSKLERPYSFEKS